MQRSERLHEILSHVQAASNLAEREMMDRKAQDIPIRTLDSSEEMQEVSLAFTSLTANLIYAGMPIHPGNEIRLKIMNAVNAALSDL